MVSADAAEHLICIGTGAHTLIRNLRGRLVPTDPTLLLQLLPLVLRHQDHRGAGIGHLTEGLVGLLQQASGTGRRAALCNQPDAVSAAQNPEDQIVLPLQALCVKEENRPLTVAVQRIQDLTQPLGILTGKAKIGGDHTGVIRIVWHSDLGLGILRIVGGGQYAGGRLALVGLVVVPDPAADGVLGRVHKPGIAEHHRRAFDAHDISLVNINDRVGQAKKAAHGSNRHIGSSVAQNGPAGDGLFRDGIIACPTVQIEDHHLLQIIQGNGPSVPAVTAADT